MMNLDSKETGRGRMKSGRHWKGGRTRRRKGR